MFEFIQLKSRRKKFDGEGEAKAGEEELFGAREADKTRLFWY
jgi:hypothetical protein